MNILCKLFGHIMKADDPHRGIAGLCIGDAIEVAAGWTDDPTQGIGGPCTCARCGHKEPGTGTKWPRNTWPPKLKTR